jgi:hypothetical protein
MSDSALKAFSGNAIRHVRTNGMIRIFISSFRGFYKVCWGKRPAVRLVKTLSLLITEDGADNGMSGK